jgi:major membrane immunogen (membrane-anchored lipoprotein)
VKHRTTAAAVLLAALAMLTACSSGSDDSSKAADVPAYKITHQDTSGNQRTVTVTVTSTKGLRAVFDDVAGKLTDDAGYFVEINCTTGATKGADNRLANGRKAVGNIGTAATGLDDGKTDYKPNAGTSCPA